MPAPPPAESLSARQASWLIFRPDEDLDADERRQLAHILEHCPDAATIRPFVHQFRRLVLEFDEAALAGWLTAVDETGVPEFAAFGGGIRRDRAAIDAMLKEQWSNGQLEGQVNRAKLLKRQTYGRANLDLLRQRVLHAS